VTKPQTTVETGVAVGKIARQTCNAATKPAADDRGEWCDQAVRADDPGGKSTIVAAEQRCR